MHKTCETLSTKTVYATKISDTLSGRHLYDQAKKWNQDYIIRTVQCIKIWLLFKKASQLQSVCLLLVMGEGQCGGRRCDELADCCLIWRGCLILDNRGVNLCWFTFRLVFDEIKFHEVTQKYKAKLRWWLPN